MRKIDYFKARVEATINPIEYMHFVGNHPGECVILDVREGTKHILNERIQGALNIPMNELHNRLEELPREKQIIVLGWDTWCNLGPLASILLIENGFDVKELIGGIATWKMLKFPVELVD